MEPLKTVHSKTGRACNLAAEAYHELSHDQMNEKAYDRNLLDSFAGRFAPGALVCDAGCGPSAHIGRYLADKGLSVTGIDISDRSIDIARALNPGIQFRREDMMHMSFDREVFDGVVSYYSIIHTPKRFVGGFFREFRRVLRPEGYLLVAVKAGPDEGYIRELLGIRTEIYFSLFTEEEMRGYLKRAGFAVDFLERRNPYDFEIKNKRTFAVGKKIARNRKCIR